MFQHLCKYMAFFLFSIGLGNTQEANKLFLKTLLQYTYVRMYLCTHAHTYVNHPASEPSRRQTHLAYVRMLHKLCPVNTGQVDTVKHNPMAHTHLIVV